MRGSRVIHPFGVSPFPSFYISAGPALFMGFPEGTPTKKGRTLSVPFSIVLFHIFWSGGGSGAAVAPLFFLQRMKHETR
jgi:hypothetical protein